jgi:NADH-quinone oxidoreductase subunit E
MARERSASLDNPVLVAMREKFPGTTDQLIPLLQFLQGELGFLSEEAMFGIADFLKVPASHVYGVATFYAQFRFKPLGKNRITCCRGTACHVRGSARILEELEKELAVKAGETTPDMEFSLETVACIGSCALAPVLVVNDKVYGKATTKRIKQIIDELKGKAPAGEVEAPEPPPKPAAKAKQAPAAAKPEKAPAAAPAKAKARPRKPVMKKAAKKAVKKAVKKATKKTGPAGKSKRR